MLNRWINVIALYKISISIVLCKLPCEEHCSLICVTFVYLVNRGSGQRYSF